MAHANFALHWHLSFAQLSRDENIVGGLLDADTDGHHSCSEADGTLWNMVPLRLILAVFSFALLTQSKRPKIFSLIQAQSSRNGAKLPNLNPILDEIYLLLVIPKVVSGGHMTSQKDGRTSGGDLKVLRKQAFNANSPQHAVNSITLKGLQIGRHAQENVSSRTADVVGADVCLWIRFGWQDKAGRHQQNLQR